MFLYAMTLLVLCVCAFGTAYSIVKVSDARMSKYWIVRVFKTLTLRFRKEVNVRQKPEGA